jgi:hypothetical protein
MKQELWWRALGIKLDIAQYNTIEGIFGAQPLETYPKNLQLIGPFVQLWTSIFQLNSPHFICHNLKIL